MMFSKSTLMNLLLVAALFLGASIRSGESFAPTQGSSRISTLQASATFDDYRNAFPENPNYLYVQITFFDNLNS